MMGVQDYTVVAFVIAAAVYVVRATWKTFAGGSKSCGSGCGKCGDAVEPMRLKGRIGLPQV